MVWLTGLSGAGESTIARALEKELKGFTGIDAPYEAPDDPEIAVHTDEQTPAESVDRILAELLPRLRLSND